MIVDELTPGRLIAQRYQLEHLLGEGGMGAVWAATHVVTKKRIALKFLKANAASSPAHVRRFLREARAASAVRHPNVLEIHDIVELDDGSPVMVMDLLLGESLAARLAQQKVLPLQELASLLLPVISAVGTAHSLGIVHRDIKPDNVFLEQGLDGSIVPRILDFGIAKLSATEGAAAETQTLTRTGSVMGTPYYMAPEQVFGERDIDQRADVWAFGVMMYEALSGQRPIDGENFGQLFKVIATGDIAPLEQLMPNLPREVTTLVGRMLSKDRAQRPQDLREVFGALSPFAQVSATSFAAPRLDLEAQRERSSAAFAPTVTPVAPTPAQFADSAGGTALLTQTPGLGAPTSEAFARSSALLPKSRSAIKWLAGAAAVTVLGLTGATLLQQRAQSASASGSASAAALPPAAPAVAAPPSSSPIATSAPPMAQSVAPRASAEPIVAKRAGARPATKPKADTAASSIPAPPAPAPAPAQRLPGGVAPNAPF